MKSALLGFNNNVQYKGQTFHIQTEDSGIQRPHIMTHLFVDGGRIVKSLKTSYADIVSEPNREALVLERMKNQHKQMLLLLKNGQIDGVLAPVSPPSLTEDAREGKTLPRVQSITRDVIVSSTYNELLVKFLQSYLGLYERNS